MNGLDIAILGVFGLSILVGVVRGFTKELLSLFNWGGATAFSYILLPLGREFVTPYIANPMMADGAALTIIFIVSLIVLSLISNIVASYIQESSFQGIDRSLGFGFGIFRGVVIVSAVELIYSTFSPRYAQSPTIQSARFVPMARTGGDTLLQLLPASLHTAIIEQAEKVENQMKNKLQEQMKDAIPHELPGGNPSQGSSQKSSLQNVHTPPTMHAPSATPMPTHTYPPSQATSIPPPSSSPMVVIRDTQPGQIPQLGTAPQASLSSVSSTNQPPPISTPMPRGLGKSTPQDPQATVAGLSQLKPQSIPKEETGYTRGQRDDMNRLFQGANGEE
jgi:membrane protein required for colicin V production